MVTIHWTHLLVWRLNLYLQDENSRVVEGEEASSPAAPTACFLLHRKLCRVRLRSGNTILVNAPQWRAQVRSVLPGCFSFVCTPFKRSPVKDCSELLSFGWFRIFILERVSEADILWIRVTPPPPRGEGHQGAKTWREDPRAVRMLLACAQPLCERLQDTIWCFWSHAHARHRDASIDMWPTPPPTGFRMHYTLRCFWSGLIIYASFMKLMCSFSWCVFIEDTSSTKFSFSKQWNYATHFRINVAPDRFILFFIERLKRDPIYVCKEV